VRRFNATLSAKGYAWFWPKIAAALTSKHHRQPALHSGGDLSATDTAAITKEITRTVTMIIITALFKVCIFMFRNSRQSAL